MQTTNQSEIVSSRASADVLFFVPSTLKLVLMSVLTFGLYDLYWFYRNWWVIRQNGVKCSPIWRTVLSPFFVYSFFSHIRKAMLANNIHAKFSVGLLSAVFIILYCAMYLPDPYGVILSFLTVIPVVAANKAALAINKAKSPAFVSNSKISIWNFLLVAVCIVLVTPSMVLSCLSKEQAEAVVEKFGLTYVHY